MKIDRTNTRNVKKLTIVHFMLLHPNELQRPVLINSHQASHGSMILFTHGNLPILRGCFSIFSESRENMTILEDANVHNLCPKES